MPWLQLHLNVDKTRTPLIEVVFETLGAVAVMLGDAGDEPMLEPGPGETPLWQATRVTGLFEGDVDADALRNTLNMSLTTDVSRSLAIEYLDDEDWERAWLARFRPMQFGERLWIRPSGRQIDAADAVIVDLDPGLAFGTGTHPTTALCLSWLDRHDLAGRSVIDFGCGSGVLAIAALKLGAARVTAVDHDPQALIATRENAARNQVDARLQVIHSDTLRPGPVDLVIANILANVLVDLAADIGRLLQTGSALVMSGILTTQADDVIAAYADICQFEPRETLDDWVLLYGRVR